MVDLRKELSLINKHVRQHGREAGSSIIWYEFLAFGEGSEYDDIYDEGPVGADGRSYAPGISIPTIYIDEIEDQFTLAEDGRQPTQNIDVTMLYQDVLRAGMSEPWEYQKHLNDMLSYDGRFFKVSAYRSRGQAPSDVIVSVRAFEIYIDQDMVFDNPPEVTAVDAPFPSTFPVVTGIAPVTSEEDDTLDGGDASSF